MASLFLEGIEIQNFNLQLKQMIRECLEEALLSTNHKKTLPSSNQNLKLLTRKETGKLLSVSMVTLSDWEKKKILIPIRIGTRVRYKLSDIENAFETSTFKSEER